MAWAPDMIKIVRGLISDMTSPYTYDDWRMQELIVVGAVMTVQEVDFATAYTINLCTNSITPDPSVASDYDFMALVSLKTACMISSGEHRDAAKTAISVKDGPSFVDTKDKAKYLGGLAENVCDAYEKAKLNYQVGDGSLGRAIVGPYGIGTIPAQLTN